MGAKELTSVTCSKKKGETIFGLELIGYSLWKTGQSSSFLEREGPTISV